MSLASDMECCTTTTGRHHPAYDNGFYPYDDIGKGTE